MIESRNFIAVHACHKEIVPRVVGWIARFIAHAVGDAPTAHVFTGSGVGEISRGKIHAAVGLFHNETANTAPSQLDGQCQTDRPGAGNENGIAVGSDGIGHRLPSPALREREGVRVKSPLAHPHLSALPPKSERKRVIGYSPVAEKSWNLNPHRGK